MGVRTQFVFLFNPSTRWGVCAATTFWVSALFFVGLLFSVLLTPSPTRPLVVAPPLSPPPPPEPRVGDSVAPNGSAEAPVQTPELVPAGDVLQQVLHPGGGNASSVAWLAPGRNLPGSERAQMVLYYHQHPANCSEHNFFVVQLRDCGLGCVLHSLSYALARSLDANRVLLVSNPEHWHFAPKDQPRRGLEHYFRPLTSCPLPTERPSPRFQTLPVLVHPAEKFNHVPHQFRSNKVGWWRAQTSRYLLRSILPWYEEHLRALGQELLPQGMPSRPCVSVHVRRSDKQREIKPYPLQTYLEAANRFRQQTAGLRSVFISSEDPAVISEATSPRFSSQWAVYFVKEERHNWDHERAARLKGNQYIADISFLNLFLHQWCDHLVITQASNWCRLIDELRSTGGWHGSAVARLGPAGAQA